MAGTFHAVVVAFEIPETLDADRLSTITVVAAVASVFVALAVLRFIRRLVTRLLVTAVAVAVAGSSWSVRSDLTDCRARCDCTVFGQQLPVPECPDDTVAPVPPSP